VDNGAESTVEYQGADIFETACRQLSIQYRHDQQGVSVKSKVLSEDVGQVLQLEFLGGQNSEMQLVPVSLPPFVDLETNKIADGLLVIIVPIAVQATQVACS
jgi:hypothetical protein